jgi:hypothetical protein
MNEKRKIRPGEEIEVGIVNGWRYLIRRSDGGGLFWVIRKGLSREDHGRRQELVGVWDTLGQAQGAARRSMERSAKAVEAYFGLFAPIPYTNK